MKPSLNFSLAKNGHDFALLCKVHSCNLPSWALGYHSPSSSLSQELSIHAWSFCFCCFDFSTSSASGVFNKLTPNFLWSWILHLSPSHSFASSVSGVDPFLLMLLSPHQPELCRLRPCWLITSFCNSFFPLLHLKSLLLVCLIYFSSFLPP